MPKRPWALAPYNQEAVLAPALAQIQSSEPPAKAAAWVYRPGYYWAHGNTSHSSCSNSETHKDKDFKNKRFPSSSRPLLSGAKGESCQHCVNPCFSCHSEICVSSTWTESLLKPETSQRGGPFLFIIATSSELALAHTEGSFAMSAECPLITNPPNDRSWGHSVIRDRLRIRRWE